MQETDRMKSDFRGFFYKGIHKWKKRNPGKEIHEIPRDTVVTALWNAAKERIHSRTRRKEIPDDLAEAVFICVITGSGPRYKLDEIYEVMTTPVDWTSFKMGILA